MTDITMDFERRQRCGVEEAVFCEGKSATQIDTIIAMAKKEDRRLLLTRLDQQKFDHLLADNQQCLMYDPLGRTAVLGDINIGDSAPLVAIVSGGASDAAVCREVETTLHYHGINCTRYEDVGVAALWRLTQRLDEIKQAKIIIAVAGMEAALPTVLSGMIANPMIAVPTSVGYGVSEGGHLALNACLGSCAAGLTTVNIDNGFGAACAAIKLINQFCPQDRVTEPRA
ncbi:nickel pincer cofactor biosynthesis protein LarB [Thaumasiovibrio sp. DFM-14]|uniref:nickel pincer cofactor biosynthesis protein LarB n=1 Tax=Thaumasiovibrio sp. DFM-14 TaxID=3384792 RepID=UPI0039A2A812